MPLNPAVSIRRINAGRKQPIKVRQAKYLSNIVELDHRAIKRRTRPMMGFKDFRCARILLGGIELLHMIARGQMQSGGLTQTPADQFYSLAKKGFLFAKEALSAPRLIATKPY
jgi:putative transposase